MTYDLIFLELYLMVLTLTLMVPAPSKLCKVASPLWSPCPGLVLHPSPLPHPSAVRHDPITPCAVPLSLFEFFTLLLPLVRDAGLSSHCVHACRSAGMRALGVWCDRACVWPLTPVCPPVCLSTLLFGHTWPRLESPTWPPGFYLFLVSFLLQSYIDSFDLCPCFSPCFLVCSLYFTVALFH